MELVEDTENLFAKLFYENKSLKDIISTSFLQNDQKVFWNIKNINFVSENTQEIKKKKRDDEQTPPKNNLRGEEDKK